MNKLSIRSARVSPLLVSRWNNCCKFKWECVGDTVIISRAITPKLCCFSATFSKRYECTFILRNYILPSYLSKLTYATSGFITQSTTAFFGVDEPMLEFCTQCVEQLLSIPLSVSISVCKYANVLEYSFASTRVLGFSVHVNRERVVLIRLRIY